MYLKMYLILSLHKIPKDLPWYLPGDKYSYKHVVKTK